MIVDRVNAGLATARAAGVKMGRGNRKDGQRSADEDRWGMFEGRDGKTNPEPLQGGTGILKIGKELGVGTATVQRVVAEQPRPFEASASV
jgi:DNA invertase Pin-like site-specific DNA recombinase